MSLVHRDQYKIGQDYLNTRLLYAVHQMKLPEIPAIHSLPIAIGLRNPEKVKYLKFLLNQRISNFTHKKYGVGSCLSDNV